jgi:tetratricopeptide (TPR) repeat protein
VRKRFVLIVLSVVLMVGVGVGRAQDVNLLPKYGGLPKNDALKRADAVFIAGMEEDYQGDRTKASSDIARRGWQYLAGGDAEDAMRRFNQAWLLDNHDGIALWGMAAVEASWGKSDESLKLFAEAEPYERGEINFAVDYAKAVGMIGVQTGDPKMLKDAYERFGRVYARAPENTLNLQNWAITLFGEGRYAEAWAKVKLAEATPNKVAVDPHFVADLEARMPRPKD